MNKRAFSRCGAALASVAFLASSLAGGASAASKYDLAKHVDDFDMQTLGYRVVSTSDGGYIVGGKTIACIARDITSMIPSKKIAKSEKDEYEFVDLEKCMMVEEITDKLPATRGGEVELPSVYDYCAAPKILSENIDNVPTDGLRGVDDEEVDEEKEDEEEPDKYYSLQCMDYMAKYDKNGNGIWMTPVEDNSDVIAVGETNSDYRMLTDYGYVYVFEKANGADDYFSYDGVAFSAKFNADGSLVSMNNEGVYLYSKNGNYVRSFETNRNEYEYTNVIVNNNGILISRIGDEKGEVFSLSDDLTKTKTRMETQNGAPIAMSMNSNDDIIIARIAIDGESGELNGFVVESFDKDNKKLGQLSFDKMDDIDFMFVNNFVATNNKSLIKSNYVGGFGDDDDEEGKDFIAMYSRDLKETARTTLTEDEIVNDVTILKNGTLVTAGGVINSSNDNGLRIHLAAKTSSKPASVDNPNTGDNIQFAGLIGGIATLGAVLLASKKFSRR